MEDEISIVRVESQAAPKARITDGLDERPGSVHLNSWQGRLSLQLEDGGGMVWNSVEGGGK